MAVGMETGTVCTNIGPAGRKHRRRIGYFLLGLTLGTAFCVPSGSAWVLVSFFPAYGACLCFLQARRSLCVRLAGQARAESPAGGTTSIEDEELNLRLQHAARQLKAEAALWAAGLAGVLYGLRMLT